MTLSIITLCHYAECRVLFITMLNVIMLSVVMLNVVMLSVVMLNVVAPEKTFYNFDTKTRSFLSGLYLTSGKTCGKSFYSNEMSPPN